MSCNSQCRTIVPLCSEKYNSSLPRRKSGYKNPIQKTIPFQTVTPLGLILQHPKIFLYYGYKTSTTDLDMFKTETPAIKASTCRQILNNSNQTTRFCVVKSFPTTFDRRCRTLSRSRLSKARLLLTRMLMRNPPKKERKRRKARLRRKTPKKIVQR